MKINLASNNASQNIEATGRYWVKDLKITHDGFVIEAKDIHNKLHVRIMVKKKRKKVMCKNMAKVNIRKTRKMVEQILTQPDYQQLEKKL